MGRCETWKVGYLSTPSLCLLIGAALLVASFTKVPVTMAAMERTSEFDFGVINAHFGYTLYAEATANCTAVVAGLSLRDPDGVRAAVVSLCAVPSDPKSFGAKHHPKLEELAFVGKGDVNRKPTFGVYRVVSSEAPSWAMDLCTEVHDAQPGLFAMLRLFLIAVAFIVCGLTLSAD